MKQVLFLSLFFFFAPTLVLAAQQESDQMQVSLFELDGTETHSFSPFEERYRGAGSIATADLGGDGVSEILIGAGTGLTPEVMIYRQDGTEVGSFLAYEETLTSGINVTSCDVDGDGTSDIVVAPKYGGGPHIRIFDRWGVLKGEFFAYSEDFRGGVHIDCGDVNGDGLDDIITGPGITGGPHVRVFDGAGTQLFEVFTGSAHDNTGITVAAADLNGDGDAEIITGRAGIGDPTIVAMDLFDDQLRFVLSLQAFADYQNGVSVVAGDIDGDGMDEIGATTQGNYQTSVVFYEMTGAKTFEHIVEEETEHGVVATVMHDDTTQLVTLITEQTTRAEEGQYIRVDLSEQTLYAYDNSALVYASLVSSGTNYYPTPQGRTEVTAKLLWHDYVWSYGEDNPNNYAIMDVKYNLRFRQHYYLHSAYWHDNFGNQMSHGCVNMPYDQVEWVYNWAEVGADVEIVP